MVNILTFDEFINEQKINERHGVQTVFAYRKNDDGDRDAVAYVEIENGKIHTDIKGQIVVEGPCFISRLRKNEKYGDYTTVLTEEEFEAFKENHVDANMLLQIQNHLLSEENAKLVSQVKEEELALIMRQCGIAKDDAKYVVDGYPLSNGYFDRGICTSYKNAKKLVDSLAFELGKEEWFVDYLKSYTNNEEIENYLDFCSKISVDELENMGYDFDAVDVTELNNSYIELDNGVIIEYYM